MAMGTVGEAPAAQKSRTDRVLELAAAVLLAMATVTSAWCVYQSERWSGVQDFRLNDSAVAGRQDTELILKANQQRLLDTVTFMRFMTALEQNNKTLEQFYMDRFRPEMRPAVEAWLATQPMTNPRAPESPLVMPQYRPPFSEDAQAAGQRAQQQYEAALMAKHQSERYTLFTVLLASVFFFAGIATHFEWPRVKVGLFLLGIVAFLVTLYQLVTCPVVF